MTHVAFRSQRVLARAGGQGGLYQGQAITAQRPLRQGRVINKGLDNAEVNHAITHPVRGFLRVADGDINHNVRIVLAK